MIKIASFTILGLGVVLLTVMLNSLLWNLL
jgi:hypothetical protein